MNANRQTVIDGINIGKIRCRTKIYGSCVYVHVNEIKRGEIDFSISKRVKYGRLLCNRSVVRFVCLVWCSGRKWGVSERGCFVCVYGNENCEKQSIFSPFLHL